MKHLLAFIILISASQCFSQSKIQTDSSKTANKIFKITILYPNGEGKTFDMNYYETKHMPMVAAYLEKNLLYYEIENGISGRTPNDKAPYLAVGSFYVKDIAEYNRAISQHRDNIISDFKNYTNIQPIIQISELKKRFP